MPTIKTSEFTVLQIVGLDAAVVRLELIRTGAAIKHASIAP